MSTRGKWIKPMSKTLKVLKEKYEGKSFSVIIGNRVNGGGGGGLLKHSCIVCGRKCSLRTSSPIGREQHAKGDARHRSLACSLATSFARHKWKAC